jgi:hypothetical protein
MKKYILTGFLVALALFGMSQNFNTDDRPIKEVAFNMTPLTKKMMPFNVQSAGFQTYAMQFRRGLRSENKFFTSAFGFNMNFLEDDDDLFHFDIRLGFESRKYFGKNLYFASGNNLLMYVHETEENILFGNDVEAGIAFDKSFVLGYNFSKHFSVYTETSFQFGISSLSVLKLEFIAPTSIYLNVKF